MKVYHKQKCICRELFFIYVKTILNFVWRNYGNKKKWTIKTFAQIANRFSQINLISSKLRAPGYPRIDNTKNEISVSYFLSDISVKRKVKKKVKQKCHNLIICKIKTDYAVRDKKKFKIVCICLYILKNVETIGVKFGLVWTLWLHSQKKLIAMPELGCDFPRWWLNSGTTSTFSAWAVITLNSSYI